MWGSTYEHEAKKPKNKPMNSQTLYEETRAKIKATLSETYLGDAPPATGARRHSWRAIIARQGRGKFGSERSKKHSEERKKIIADTKVAKEKAAKAKADGGDILTRAGDKVEGFAKRVVGAVKKRFRRPKEETNEETRKAINKRFNRARKVTLRRTAEGEPPGKIMQRLVHAGLAGTADDNSGATSRNYPLAGAPPIQRAKKS
jgi:hypothetical protein